MSLTTDMTVYGTDFSDEHEYSSCEIGKEFNDDWNQVKGIKDYSYGFVASFLSAVKRLRKEEIEQREIQKQEKLEIEQKTLENSIKKEIQNNPEESESESESDSDDEIEFKSNFPIKVQIPPIVDKFDFKFPSVMESLTMKPDDNGWKEVANKISKVKIVELSSKKTLDAVLKKSQMCKSTKNGITISKCPHGKSCRFAHSLDELSPRECVYGQDCKFIEYKGIYCCNYGNKLCLYKHPEEKIEDYLVRTGLKKLPSPTEEEMQNSFDEYIESEAPKKEEKIIKKQNFKPFVCKKSENIQCKPLKKVFISNKPIVVKPEKLETLKIAKRNEISLKIRDANLVVKRNSDTISRFREMRDLTTFYKNQIEKLDLCNKEKQNEIKNLKQILKDVEFMKIEPKSMIIEEKPMIVDAKTAIVEEKPVIIEEKPVIIDLIQLLKELEPTKFITESVSMPIIEKEWIQVVNKHKKKVETEKPVVIAENRNIAFEILKNAEKINSTRTKTKMCFRGQNCKYKGCTFAHSEKELKISNCIFGCSCKYVKKESGILVNIDKRHICNHKHNDETLTEFYVRVGIINI